MKIYNLLFGYKLYTEANEIEYDITCFPKIIFLPFNLGIVKWIKMPDYGRITHDELKERVNSYKVYNGNL